MTNEQINLAIARALGWHSIHTSKTGIKGMKGPLRRFMPIPNYCNCLNAMHEAEKVFDCPDPYESALIKISGGAEYLWHATARQRAEAFLRTVDKWKEVQA